MNLGVKKFIQVQYIPIDLLKEWDRNPRKNDSAVERLSKLIQSHGFINPVIATEDNIIRAGHTRVKAAKRAGLKEVPVILIDMDEKQAQAFAIADNKSSEWAEWDFTKLKDLMEDLDTGELDLELTGFDNQEIEKLLVDIKDPVDLLEPGQFRDEIEYFNLSKFYPSTSNDYGIPDIQKQDIDIYGLMGFNFCLSSSKKEDKENTIHYFLDDYQFERVWNSPSVYLKILQKFNGCLSPDFSLYTDFPIALQIYNTYRNRWLAAYWQENNINVIPTVSWSNKESYEFCFLGIPETSPVAVSTVGIMKDKTYQKNFMNGFNKMLEVIKPEKVIIYGESFPELDKIETPLIYFKAFQTKHREV